MAVSPPSEPKLDSGPPKVKPFLRWAGSKRKLLGRLSVFWSPKHTAYVEPFAGSACLFFELAPETAILGDTNSELIELFEVVRDAPDRLHRRLTHIPRDLDTYNRWRRMNPKSMDQETRALRFFYLNRNCFNGIYRTNANGQFNVPMGSKLSAYVQRGELARCSAMLRNVTLVNGDFIDTLAHVKPGNFVYLDPPYAVNSRRIFKEYGKKVFDTSDIERFSEALVAIDKTKADFLVSYADCREARALAKHWNSVRFPVRRNIAGFAGARRNAYEWLITNCSDRTAELAAWSN